MESRFLLSANPVQPLGGSSLDALTTSAVLGQQQTVSSSDKLIGLDRVESEYGFSGAGQTVAVIDTGVAYDHSALGGGYGAGHRVVGGYDFAENDNNPYDDGQIGSHGTHVAGIVAGNDARVSGVASGADIVALRVFDDQGHSQFSWIEQALRWVHTHRNSFVNPITTVNLSLGVTMNSETVPSWAVLEDEFAQLAADGIFISVAAGNGFATYQTVGLCYPAVSPYVVPVASVDANGSLSYFSQRDSRVLAAPGRGILSSIPDYAGNNNGVADDYAAYSGTSMAAPCVAGASMLLRQAYAFSGAANVGEQTLYSTLLATADSVYDSVTGAYYHRLNIDRAIDSVMPADDFGSTAAAAANIGTVASTLSIKGTIAQLGDSDWFSFKAGASGKVTLAVAASGDLAPRWQLSSLPAGAVCDGNTVTLTVTAGQTYTVGLATGKGLGRYTMDVRLDATPVATPVVRVGREVRISGTSGNDSLVLSAGDVYRLTVNGVDYQFSRGSVNSFIFDGGAGNDTIVIIVGSGNATAALKPGSVDLSAQGYAVHVIGVENATVRAGLGTCRATLYDSSGNDTLSATPAFAQLSGPGYVNRVEGFASVSVVASSGFDVAWLYDSAGNDTLSVGAGDTTLSGRGFSNRVRYFDEVHASGEAGGYDTAVLYNLTETSQLLAAGKKAEVRFRASAAGGPSDQFSSTSLTGFKYVRAICPGGKVTPSRLAALDFVLAMVGRQA